MPSNMPASGRIVAPCPFNGSAQKITVDHLGTPTSSQKFGRRAVDNAGSFRNIEMGREEQMWVFSQTVMPDASPCAHRAMNLA
jgi:hypothetical protein